MIRSRLPRLRAIAGNLPRAFVAATLFATLAVSSVCPQTSNRAVFVPFEAASPAIASFVNSGLPGTNIATAAGWDSWIRQQDHDVRARIDRGVEDSISNLALFGTSFTKLPRVESMEAAITPENQLTENAQARLRDLQAALAGSSQDERIVFVRQFLGKNNLSANGRAAFLAANLKRAAAEQREYHRKLQAAADSGDKAAALEVRGTLYAARGLSADTSLLPNFAVEDTLRVMLAKGALRPGSILRVAIVGPGLDFTDKRDGYDFYPLQTIQPFAVMEAVERLGLGKRGAIDVVSLDLNAAVNAHVIALAARGKQGRPYAIQLPRDARADWTGEALAYWQHFGESIASLAKPLPVPGQLPSLRVRAVAVTADRAARLSAMDLNIVTQYAELADAQKFDLVIATNILVYYDQFQQALAMGNVARMMNAGGIFISNTPLPAAHDESLKYLGGRSVSYSPDHSYGDDIVVYRRQ
jgi:hypothetical protein